MDAVVEKLVALGIPELVLLVAIATSGLAGGAAIVAALAFLGGPFGREWGECCKYPNNDRWLPYYARHEAPVF